MTVAELIQELQRQDPNAKVVFHDVWNDVDVELNNVEADDGQVELF